MPNIPLEDNYTDILGKAMRGLKLSDTDVAARTGVGVPQLQTLKAGEFSSAVASKVAPVLGLNPSALAALAEKRYAPADVNIEGLAQYLVWDPSTKEAAVFDTGSDASAILAEAQSKGLTIKHIFITHTHGDHIFDLDRLREKTGAKVWSGSKEPVPGTEIFETGQSWQLGKLNIESRLTWGHSQGGVTYVVSGLDRPVAIVGDSIFAGSMGGGGVSYTDAVKNNLEQILTLPNTTVIAPGHGPLTSVGEEQQNNPFFAR
jgi:hydroxyacylglutathione hydrolase